MANLKDLKDEVKFVKEQLKNAQGFLANLGDRLKQLFLEHKTEVVTVFVAGFLVGSILS